MELKKQDRNGVRTASDVERKHDFKKLDEVDDYEARIEDLELNKVDKVAGKNLSSNDFTNGYKRDLEANTQARHEHNNKVLLDTYTFSNEQVTGAVGNTHTHSNKSLLDSYTQSNTDIADAIAKEHTHNNKALLDSYTQSNADITDAIAKEHTHDNKTFLDSINGGTSIFDLNNYKVSALTILRNTCISKNKRLCISLVGQISIPASTTTTIFNLPVSLRPATQKDFMVFGTTSTGSVCGYGYILTTGVVQVWFPSAITTYIRTSFVYDIDY